MHRFVRTILVVFALGCGAALAQVPAPAPVPLRVISFDGGWNLPVWAAQRQGFFEANGVSVQIAYTPSSPFLVNALIEGRVDIALALIDNLVALQEGQGEVKSPDAADVVAFMGSDGGFLSLVAAPSIATMADLKGKTLSIDSPSSGAVFVQRELLARGGLADGDVRFERAGGTANRYRELLAGKHDATILRTPFELQAQTRGYRVLASADSLGAYQGTAGFVRRSWAASHEAALVGFLRGYRAAVDWINDPANREIVEALLVANSRDMTPALARPSYDLLLGKGGLSRDLSIDPQGIATVLALRSKYAQPPKPLTDPAKYVDLTWHKKAFGAR